MAMNSVILCLMPDRALAGNRIVKVAPSNKKGTMFSKILSGRARSKIAPTDAQSADKAM